MRVFFVCFASDTAYFLAFFISAHHFSSYIVKLIDLVFSFVAIYILSVFLSVKLSGNKEVAVSDTGFLHSVGN